MASPGLSRVQQLCFGASAVATSVGFFVPWTAPSTGEAQNRFRYEAVTNRPSWELGPNETKTSRQVLIACERRRKEMTERNEDEQARCLDNSKIVPPLNVLWITGLAGSGMLLGMGLALSFGEIGARRRMWIGGVLGFCLGGGSALGAQSYSRAVRLEAGAEYCRSMAGTMRKSTAQEYANCIAHGLGSVEENPPARSGAR